jgi:transcriptional regulator with XRE-family HTH domain
VRDADAGVSPRHVFGAMLRFYRMRSGLSQEQFGARIHYSPDQVGKVENAQRSPTEDFTAACDAVPELRTDGALTELRERLKHYFQQRAYPGWFAHWPDAEATATTLRWYELITVPGLLQTEDYARAVLSTRVKATEDDIAEMVETRLARQAVLERADPPMLWVILAEGVLRCPVGGPTVMSAQLGHLMEAARRPNVVIQVIPTGTGAHEGFRGPFIVADFAAAPSLAYQDTAVRGQIVEDADDIAALMSLWDTLKSEALPRSASVVLMEEAARQWT